MQHLNQSKLIRGRFEGVCNIVRFNWHFFAIAVVLIAVALMASFPLPASFGFWLRLLALAGLIAILLPLLVSWYVYDLSGLYHLRWLAHIPTKMPENIWNIHAGFDETSELLRIHFPNSTLKVLDFYHPERHTEISIRRARKFRPPSAESIVIDSNKPRFPDNAPDLIFLLFAAHEIRARDERIHFFLELRQSLKRGGSIVVLEHTRDLANSLAYQIGVFHFLHVSDWKDTFYSAGLTIKKSIKINPFVTLTILQPNEYTA